MTQEKGSIHRIDRFRSSLFSLQIELPAIAETAVPGQFVHMKVEGVQHAILRRPLSIAGVNGNIIRLIVRIVGSGTERLAEYKVGQTSDFIGPLGSGFDIGDVETAYLIGGGIGDAPLLFLQDESKNRGIKTHLFVGSLSHDEFPLEDEEVKERGLVNCTDDGSFGFHGFVTAAFEEQMKRGVKGNTRAYTCGPVPMMKEAARLCKEYGIPLQVSLENRMGCGVGVCQGCATKLKDTGERGGFQLVCVDGPVFNAEEIDWSLF